MNYGLKCNIITTKMCCVHQHAAPRQRSIDPGVVAPVAGPEAGVVPGECPVEKCCYDMPCQQPKQKQVMSANTSRSSHRAAGPDVTLKSREDKEGSSTDIEQQDKVQRAQRDLEESPDE